MTDLPQSPTPNRADPAVADIYQNLHVDPDGVLRQGDAEIGRLISIQLGTQRVPGGVQCFADGKPVGDPIPALGVAHDETAAAGRYADLVRSPRFDRPLDVDFDSALIRQLDDQQRLSAQMAIHAPPARSLREREIDAHIAAAHAKRPITDRLGEVHVNDGSKQARPVPARNTPPRDPSADEWAGTDRATPGEIRQARIVIGAAGLVTVIGLLVLAYFGG